MAKPERGDREICLFAARAHLTEAARRRNHPANKTFYWTLLDWVANARRKAAMASFYEKLFRDC